MMAKLRTKFIDGAVERDIARQTAEALFDGIAKFAEYGFNRAHSAAYGVIAYQTAYLKANYPLEYMTSLLINMEGSADRVATGIVDCRARGIEVLAPDINRSRADFSIGDGRILFGLAAIKNVGSHAVESIVEMRDADGPFKSLEDLCERASVIQDVNRRVLESLVQSGACDSLGERAWLLAVLEHFIARAEQARRDRDAGQTNWFDEMCVEEADKNFGLAIDVVPMPSEEKLRLEKELLGLYLSDHPLRRISKELAERSDTQAVEVTSALQDTEVRVAGLVREVRRVVTRKGQIMAYASLEDLTGTVDIVLFPRVFEQTRLLFETDKVVVVQGKVDARAGSTRATGSAAAPPVEPEIESEVEVASIVADQAWLWDDPACLPVTRRQLLHVRLAGGDSNLAERLEAVFARHPGTDEVVLHVVVGSREVTVHADRYHVLAGPALTAEIDELVGAASTRLETVRAKAQANGNGRGKRER